MEHKATLLGDGLAIEKMHRYWLLARMGKRVLRPCGLELTKQMPETLALTDADHVIEFALGLGVTPK
ncbi:MAG: hypothetical protein AAFR81_21620 [Chloroflexota bacterium]